MSGEKLKEGMLKILEPVLGFSKVPDFEYIDFDKSFNKYLVSRVICCWHYYLFNIGEGIWWTTNTIFIGFTFSRGDFLYLGWFLLIFLFLNLGSFVSDNFFYRFYTHTRQNIIISSTKKILETDPIFYSKKSTGEIITKINRGAVSVCYILKNLRDGSISLISVLLAPVSSIFLIPGNIFWLMLASIIFPALVYYFMNKAFAKKLLEEADNSEDRAQELVNETVVQLPYIRSIFATTELFQNLNNKAKKTSNNQTISKNYQQLTSEVFYLISISFMAFVSYQIFVLVQAQKVDTLNAASIVLVYFSSNSRIKNILENYYTIRDQYIQSNNLWKYIQNFGNQSFPVLESNADKLTKNI